MIRGIERGDIVSGEKDREELVYRMGMLADETKTKIYAWSIMSNHAHILLRSGPNGLARYMRRFLSSYAGYYNRRHQRYGHVFQNRYRSIVCEEEPYFMELVGTSTSTPCGRKSSTRWLRWMSIHGADTDHPGKKKKGMAGYGLCCEVVWLQGKL